MAHFHGYESQGNFGDIVFDMLKQRTGASYNYLLVNGVRRPTSRELLRLQGFPEKYKIAVSHQDIRRQTGNSVAVPMIRMVAQKINEIIENKEKHGTPETQRLKAVAYA